MISIKLDKFIYNLYSLHLAVIYTDFINIDDITYPQVVVYVFLLGVGRLPSDVIIPPVQYFKYVLKRKLIAAVSKVLPVRLRQATRRRE